MGETSQLHDHEIVQNSLGETCTSSMDDALLSTACSVAVRTSTPNQQRTNKLTV